MLEVLYLMDQAQLQFPAVSLASGRRDHEVFELVHIEEAEYSTQMIKMLNGILQDPF
jgi:hypothetical protein